MHGDVVFGIGLEYYFFEVDNELAIVVVII